MTAVSFSVFWFMEENERTDSVLLQVPRSRRKLAVCRQFRRYCPYKRIRNARSSVCRIVIFTFQEVARI